MGALTVTVQIYVYMCGMLTENESPVTLALTLSETVTGDSAVGGRSSTRHPCYAR